MVMPTIASCIHHITHRTTDRRHGSKKVVLIMPSGWTASCGMSGSLRCKAKSIYWVHHQRRQQRPLYSGTLVKSREADRENGYENRSPVFSYERCPSIDLTRLHQDTCCRIQVISTCCCQQWNTRQKWQITIISTVTVLTSLLYCTPLLLLYWSSTSPPGYLYTWQAIYWLVGPLTTHSTR